MKRVPSIKLEDVLDLEIKLCASFEVTMMTFATFNHPERLSCITILSHSAQP